MKNNLEKKLVCLYINIQSKIIMPSYKNNINNNNNNNNNDTYNEDDLLKIDEENNANFLKEVFTIDDYLNCEKTKYLLEQDRKWKNLNFEEELYIFFHNEVKYCNNNYKPFFSNNLCNFNKLLNIINKNIKHEYDLNIFYENTLLAQPLINKMDYNNELYKINKKKEIAENYNKKCKSKGKLFNWNNKKYY